MFNLADWMLAVERSRAALNKTGQDRLAQLAFAARTERKAGKKMQGGPKDTSEPVEARCQPCAA